MQHIIYAVITFVLFSLGSCVNVENSQNSAASNSFSAHTNLTNLTDALPTNVASNSSFHNQPPPPGATQEFSTAFEKSLVDFKEIISGGPPKDGIPALSNPLFVSMQEADEWLADTEVVFVADYREFGISNVRIYPVQILIYHEIVNDSIEGLDVVVTYCPLCNSAAAFGRTINGVSHNFGVSGRLRYSNLIMYDNLTESWWQQATGNALVGTHVGLKLRSLPLLTLSWKRVKSLYSSAVVLSKETGYNRPYGRNPYVGYDTLDHPFLYFGPDIEEETSAFTRVLVLKVDGVERAYQYPDIATQVVINDIIAGQHIVVLWSPESASPLDAATVSGGRNVGSANAFFSLIEDTTLNFFSNNDNIYDTETQSTWSVNGQAISGYYKDSLLRAVPSVQHFWFSWSAFRE